ncbi:MAG TPA: hypothetical protein VIA18_08015, partial [Polyangia bacterium]|nr:hypothetical protein [Polyangia bacterium]
MLAAIDTASGASAVAIPDTPAGHTFRAWLTAFNSGERAKMVAYCDHYDSTSNADDMLAFYRHTGGVDVVAIDKSERLHLEFRIKDRGTPTVGLGKFDVDDRQPAHVVAFNLRAMPPGMSVADMNITVDAATRARILDGIEARLAEWYVYPDVAKKMAAAIRAHQKRGDYDAITDGEALSSKLTEHLRAVSHDKHLRVTCVPEVLPKDEPKGEPQIDAATRTGMEANNCGFERVERLASNVGY